MTDEKQTLAANDKRVALQKWLRDRSTRKALIPHCAREGKHPLSFAQERLWFLQQLQPDFSGFHLFITLRMRGTLDIPALKESFHELTQRHMILRTLFPEIQGQPFQYIADHSDTPFHSKDLQSYAAHEQYTMLLQFIHEEYHHPFDLTRGPLLRVAVFTLAPEEYVLLITIHHLITDGWSNGLLLKELGKHYKALHSNQASPVAEPMYQYVDIVHWEHQRWQEGAQEKALAYWRAQLAAIPALLPLPTDYPRPAIQSSDGMTLPVAIPLRVLQSFLKVCQQERVTPIMGLLALLNVLLFRYTGQEDLLVGLPIFNRPHSETEEVLGLFVNTLVIRSSLSHTMTFRTLLSQVRGAMLAAYEHRDYPFEKLVEILQPERTISHSPIFQVMLSVAAMDTSPLAWPGLIIEPYPITRQSTQADLTLEVAEDTHSLQLAFAFRTSLFKPATIERMAHHFHMLMESAVEEPEKPIDLLRLLTSSDYTQIIETWNATQVALPAQRCLHELFAEQVERTPDAIAAVAENQQITYRALDQRANQLAHFLRLKSVQSEMFVGIAMERSLDLITGLLAILKAGAAFVPLDITYPQERLNYLIKDTGIAVLLTQEALLQRISIGREVITICLDRDWHHVALHPQQLPASQVVADNLAYVIYTSGSSGTPKGVLTCHRAVSHRLLSMQDQYRLTSTDAVLQKTSISFDVSIWELFWPLMSGARLVFARPGSHGDAPYLVETMRKEQITVAHFVPSLLQYFLEEPEVQHCTSLRSIMCGGEMMTVDLQERFLKRMHVPLHNFYGPAETAIEVITWPCVSSSHREYVPIGRPVANTQIYLLDHQLQPVPIGVGGELFIGGIQVSRGYHKQPEMTARQFIPDPFSQQPGSRLYKTGDMARYHEDGTIEFLGRIDNQVKVRGQRIELEEIEALLKQHPAVQEAVVSLHEFGPADKRLVAYFTAQADKGATNSELHDYLHTRLPGYMVPGILRQIAAMPLTPNGKIDRRALPPPQNLPVQDQTKFSAPDTDIEWLLVTIWQEVLQISQIGAEENFFELGGHSLLVTRVRSRLQEQLGIELPLVDLFQFTTIRALARHISQKEDRQKSPRLSIEMRAQRQRQTMKQRRSTRR